MNEITFRGSPCDFAVSINVRDSPAMEFSAPGEGCQQQGGARGRAGNWNCGLPHLCTQESSSSHSPKRGHDPGRSRLEPAVCTVLECSPSIPEAALPSPGLGPSAAILRGCASPFWQTGDGSRAATHSFSQRQRVQRASTGKPDARSHAFFQHCLRYHLSDISGLTEKVSSQLTQTPPLPSPPPKPSSSPTREHLPVPLTNTHLSPPS